MRLGRGWKVCFVFFYNLSFMIYSLELIMWQYVEIRVLREKMWKDVLSRTHQVDKVFVGVVEDEAEGECEVMVFGGVVYRLKKSNGGEVSGGEWSARGRLKVVEGKWRWMYYRVFLNASMVVLEGDGDERG
ncbi:hypothetical protein QBC44DRAFT_325046 [Cladorrhinum sp. PSN332]|nr:hypothetical protein QBC44DRAFT_325046 [Cladorrhinum sp. PSN332]